MEADDWGVYLDAIFADPIAVATGFKQYAA